MAIISLNRIWSFQFDAFRNAIYDLPPVNAFQKREKREKKIFVTPIATGNFHKVHTVARQALKSISVLWEHDSTMRVELLPSSTSVH